MILNRIETGTPCIVRETGKAGVVKQIFFYPTKYEIEFPNGQIGHFHSKDIELEGIQQKQVSLKLPEIPQNGIGKSWTDWIPFRSDSFIEHHFSTTKEIIWEVLTSIEMYNVWFYGIQRALPVKETKRYVHKYSFSKLDLKPGAHFKIRPKTIAPWFSCRIMTIEKENKFGFTFKTTPLSTEYVEFTLKESDYGVWVSCKRASKGIFSILDQLNWQEKSKNLQRLDQIIPKVNFELQEEEISSSQDNSKSSSGGIESLSKEEKVAYLVNKGLDGDMDAVNNYNDKVIRGKTKAMIVKINRGSVERPALPAISNIGKPPASSGGLESLSKEEKVAYFVNKGLDGDMDAIDNCTDKILRGKAKAMIVKIKRGSLDRPSMPEMSIAAESNSTESGFESLSKEDQIAFLANKGLDGDMDFVNKHPDKVIRAKAKAMVVKVKRGSLDRPSMPDVNTKTQSNNQKSDNNESDDQKIERLITSGIDGNMDEINSLEDKVLRGKIKAAIIKAKRNVK